MQSLDKRLKTKTHVGLLGVSYEAQQQGNRLRDGPALVLYRNEWPVIHSKFYFEVEHRSNDHEIIHMHCKPQKFYIRHYYFNNEILSYQIGI